MRRYPKILEAFSGSNTFIFESTTLVASRGSMASGVFTSKQEIMRKNGEGRGFALFSSLLLGNSGVLKDSIYHQHHKHRLSLALLSLTEVLLFLGFSLRNLSFLSEECESGRFQIYFRGVSVNQRARTQSPIVVFMCLFV